MCLRSRASRSSSSALRRAKGVNGAKTEYCIDKHGFSITRPYHAALREAARSKEAVPICVSSTMWLESLASSCRHPTRLTKPTATVIGPYAEFNEWIKAIRILGEAPAKPSPRRIQTRSAPVTGQRSERRLAGRREANSNVTVDLARIFGPEWPLARDLPAYPFATQLAMADAVARAIDERGQLLAEAGTAPARPFPISSPPSSPAARSSYRRYQTLQDQLFQRDLPLVRDALKVPVTVALLKAGRITLPLPSPSAGPAGGIFASPRWPLLKRIESFARTSTTGDKAELGDVPATPHLAQVPRRVKIASVAMPELRRMFRHERTEGSPRRRRRRHKPPPVSSPRRAEDDGLTDSSAHAHGDPRQAHQLPDTRHLFRRGV